MAVKYLIDNNILNRLPARCVESAAFAELCVVPEEVLYEARDSRQVSRLEPLVAPITHRVLVSLVHVMRAVQVGDFSVLDLYRNQGNADPLIVATALDKRDGQLFGDEWLIVSEDQGVRTLAERFDLPVLTCGELQQRLDHTL